MNKKIIGIIALIFGIISIIGLVFVVIPTFSLFASTFSQLPQATDEELAAAGLDRSSSQTLITQFSFIFTLGWIWIIAVLITSLLCIYFGITTFRAAGSRIASSRPSASKSYTPRK